MIQVSQLSKQFGPFSALRDVHLSVGPGEFVVLMGPNGAGKTTLMRILATLARPTSGSVSIAGHVLPKGADLARRRIGFLSHQTLLYSELSAEENLRFFARLYDVLDVEARVDVLLEQVGLEERRRDRVRTYSRGMQQRLAIARVLLHDPGVILLDEPFSGLDPEAADRLAATLRELHDGQRTLVMTTHDLDRGLALGDRALVLVRGRMAYEASRAEFGASSFGETYRQVVKGKTRTGHQV